LQVDEPHPDGEHPDGESARHDERAPA
jgi:hypothetical protein